jgi:hypothetical protein
MYVLAYLAINARNQQWHDTWIKHISLFAAAHTISHWIEPLRTHSELLAVRGGVYHFAFSTHCTKRSICVIGFIAKIVSGTNMIALFLNFFPVLKFVMQISLELHFDHNNFFQNASFQSEKTWFLKNVHCNWLEHRYEIRKGLFIY